MPLCDFPLVSYLLFSLFPFFVLFFILFPLLFLFSSLFFGFCMLLLFLFLLFLSLVLSPVSCYFVSSCFLFLFLIFVFVCFLSLSILFIIFFFRFVFLFLFVTLLRHSFSFILSIHFFLIYHSSYFSCLNSFSFPYNFLFSVCLVLYNPVLHFYCISFFLLSFFHCKYPYLVLSHNLSHTLFINLSLTPPALISLFHLLRCLLF